MDTLVYCVVNKKTFEIVSVFDRKENAESSIGDSDSFYIKPVPAYFSILFSSGGTI